MPAFWNVVWLHLPELGLVLAGLLGLVCVGEGLRRMGMTAAATRRLVHAGVGLVVAGTPWLFAAPAAVYLLAVVFAVANATAWYNGWLPGIHGARSESIGTITFPLVLLPALVVGWSLDPGRVWAFQVSFLLLALCDPLAAWVGTSMRRPGRYRIGRHYKSVAGSAAFAIASGGLTMVALLWARTEGVIDWSLRDVVIGSLVVAAVTTAVEALGNGGWDNVTIVLAALLTLIYADEHPGSRMGMGMALLAGLAFAGVAFRAEALSRSGAVAGGLLAWTLLAVEGWAWAVPGFTFFVLSTALSRVGRSRKVTTEVLVEKPGARDAGQVLANGGVAWLLLAVHVAEPWSLWYVGFLGAFAAATADTWATELGALASGKPRLLTTGQQVPTGTSGAVSLPGTLAAAAGAGTIALAAAPFMASFISVSWGALLVLIVGSGLAGAFMDSLLGATLQAQYVDSATGHRSERPPAEAGAQPPVRGWRWLRNDAVNVTGTATGAAVAMACFPWL